MTSTKNQVNKISKRKLESYRRAEIVCRELRWEIAKNKLDMNHITTLVINWMRVTGKIKYQRPTIRGTKNEP